MWRDVLIHFIFFGFEELMPSFSMEPMNLFLAMSSGGWSCYEMGL